MSTPLMPKATAVWLIDNTTLTFDQIAAFCNLHPLELQGIADGEVAQGIVGADPIVAGQMTQEELDRCIQDPGARLAMIEPSTPLSRRKGPRYTPVSRRQDRPDAISWLVRFHPELTDGQVSKLVGTTKPTINAVRDRTHWNSPNIKPKDPVALALCSQIELDEAVAKAARRVERQKKKQAAVERAAAKAAGSDPAEVPQEPTDSGEATPEPEAVTPVLKAVAPAPEAPAEPPVAPENAPIDPASVFSTPAPETAPDEGPADGETATEEATPADDSGGDAPENNDDGEPKA